MKSNNVYKAEDLPENVQPLAPLDVVKIIKSEIESREIADGFKGYGVDTSTHLKIELEFYEVGLAGGVPSAWRNILKKADPEYDEYLRLQKKFE